MRCKFWKRQPMQPNLVGQAEKERREQKLIEDEAILEVEKKREEAAESAGEAEETASEEVIDNDSA